jgi:mannitol-1-phosphate 5-dehydrogenase
MCNMKNKLEICKKRIVIFGAGKIGRAFIGQLFGRGGYELVFVDIDQQIVSELNRRKKYRVIFQGETIEDIIIRNVRAISASDKEAVTESVASAGIVAISVGKNAVLKIVPHIAGGLIKRFENSSGSQPLDIIIAENMRSAGAYVHKQLQQYLPDNFPVDEFVGLVDTSIGKMAPLMTEADLSKDPLLLHAEPYNTLILDKNGFRGKIPDIAGLMPKKNIRAWIDRKAFIHNLGHASVAYFGAFRHPGATYVHEILKDAKVYRFAREVMLQSAEILLKYYPEDFTLEDLLEHIDDLLLRFQNTALKDTIYRIGMDLPRKLASGDRFVGIIRMAQKSGLPFDKILLAMSYSFHFNARSESDEKAKADIAFLNKLSDDFETHICKTCGFEPETDGEQLLQLKLYFHCHGKIVQDRLTSRDTLFN